MSTAWARGVEAGMNVGERETFRLWLPMEDGLAYEDGFQVGMMAWSLRDAWEQWERRGDAPTRTNGSAMDLGQER